MSSITNDVWSETSSVPLNESVTVCPANEDRLKDFWAYPVFLFRFEYVARVVLPALTVSLSYAVVVVVSAVSMCSQNVNVAAHPAGIVTDCVSVSVWVVPYPSSHAFQLPEWAGSPVELSMTPEDAVHGAAVPVSKPGLPSFCPGLLQPPPLLPIVHVNVVEPEALVVSLAVTVEL